MLEWIRGYVGLAMGSGCACGWGSPGKWRFNETRGVKQLQLLKQLYVAGEILRTAADGVSRDL